MGFNYSEFKKFREDIVKSEKEFEKFLSGFLLEEGLRALTITKENTPVQTGLLRSMWQLGDSRNVVKYNGGNYTEDFSRSKSATIKSVTRSGNDLIIEIYNAVNYASYIEDGHKQEVGRYVPAIGKRLKAAYVDGKGMARLAIEQIEREIPSRFEQQFKVWMSSLGLS